MELIDGIRTALTLVAVLLLCGAMFMIYNYKEEITAKPCELCNERGTFVCIPNPEIYRDCLFNQTNQKWYCALVRYDRPSLEEIDEGLQKFKESQNGN